MIHEDTTRPMVRAGKARAYLGWGARTFRRALTAGRLPVYIDEDTQTEWFSYEALDAFKRDLERQAALPKPKPTRKAAA